MSEDSSLVSESSLVTIAPRRLDPRRQRTAERIVGYSPASLVGTTLMDYLAPDDVGTLRRSSRIGGT